MISLKEIPDIFFWGLFIIYSVPIFRLVFSPFNLGKVRLLAAIGVPLGELELLFGDLRNYVIGSALIILFGFHLYFIDWIWWTYHYQITLYFVFFIVLSFADIYQRKKYYQKIINWANHLKHPHPVCFFKYYYLTFGPFGSFLPPEIEKIDPCEVFFKTSETPKISIEPVFAGLMVTCALSRLMVKAHKWFGVEASAALGDVILELWGAAIAKIAKLDVICKGLEKLEGLSGRNILLLNHKSFMDFVLGPLPFGAIKLAHDSKMHLRFLAAKDHFLDNFVFHSVFGIGRSAEAMGTIFVDRKKKDEGKSILAIDEAASALAERDVCILMYPQGTRAHPNFGKKGERVDASFYAVGDIDRLKKEGAYLKKGAAHLATDTAIKLSGKNMPVNIIPVCLDGTATVCPKKSFKLQTNTTVNISIGNPITIESSEVKGIKKPRVDWPGGTPGKEKYNNFVNELHHRIADVFLDTCRVRTRLERRFLVDIQQFLGQHEQEDVNASMKVWRNGKDELIYIIIDYIYACEVKNWRLLLGELAQLMMKSASRNEYEKLKNRVAEIVAKS